MIGKVQIFVMLQLPEVPLLLVDALVAWPQEAKPGLARKYFGEGKESCHLTVDGPITGLHNFALRLGLRRSWFQPCPPASWAHYDLTANKRALALEIGALAMDSNALVAREHAWRANAHANASATKSEPWTCDCPPCKEVRALGGFMQTEKLWEDAVRAARRAMPEGTRHRLCAALEDAGFHDGEPRWSTGVILLRSAVASCIKVSPHDPALSATTQEAMLFGHAADLALKWVQAIVLTNPELDPDTQELLRAVERAALPMRTVRAPKKRGAP